jgi:hypothetical protein
MKAQPTERGARLKQGVDLKRVAKLVLRWLGVLAAAAAVALLIRFYFEYR